MSQETAEKVGITIWEFDQDSVMNGCHSSASDFENPIPLSEQDVDIINSLYR